MRWVLLAIVLGCWLRKTGLPCFTSERAFLFISGPHRLETAWGCRFVGRSGGGGRFPSSTQILRKLRLMRSSFLMPRDGWRWQRSHQCSPQKLMMEIVMPGQTVQLGQCPQSSQAVGVIFWRRWEPDQRLPRRKTLGTAKLEEEVVAAVGVVRFLWTTNKCQRGRELSQDADKCAQVCTGWGRASDDTPLVCTGLESHLLLRSKPWCTTGTVNSVPSSGSLDTQTTSNYYPSGNQSASGVAVNDAEGLLPSSLWLVLNLSPLKHKQK